MAETAREIMQTDFGVIDSQTPLSELEREFIDKSAAIFPVKRDDKIVGVISRTDLVRQLYVERSRAETIHSTPPEVQPHPDAEETSRIAHQVGERLESLKAEDVMIHNVISVSPETTAAEMARTMVDSEIHELLVMERDEIVGVVASLDVLRVFAS